MKRFTSLPIRIAVALALCSAAHLHAGSKSIVGLGGTGSSSGGEVRVLDGRNPTLLDFDDRFSNNNNPINVVEWSPCGNFFLAVGERAFTNVVNEFAQQPMRFAGDVALEGDLVLDGDLLSSGMNVRKTLVDMQAAHDHEVASIFAMIEELTADLVERSKGEF